MNKNKMKTKQPTLLEKAMAIPTSRHGRPIKCQPDVDTALAWLRQEIRMVQICRALWPDKNPVTCTTGFYSFINQSLRLAYNQGRIKIV